MEFLNQVNPINVMVFLFIFISILLINKIHTLILEKEKIRQKAKKIISSEIVRRKTAVTQSDHMRKAISDYVDKINFLQKSVNTLSFQREELAEYTEELEHDLLATIVEKNYYEAELEALDVDN